MSIIFCLRDIEHIELLYEDDSDVWKILSEHQKTKDTKTGAEKKTTLIIQKVINRLNLIIPLAVLGVFVCILVYLLLYQFVLAVANIIDFSVAMMSVIVLIISHKRIRTDEKSSIFGWLIHTFYL